MGTINRKNSYGLRIAAFVAATLAAGSAQAILIDNFDSGNDTVVSGFNPGPSNTVSADAIGGSRTLEILAGPPGATTLAVANGALNHGQTPVSGGSSKVTWDANGAGLMADLTDGGMANGIQLEIIAIDVGMVDLAIMVEDGVGGTASLLLSGLLAGSQSFFFSDFVGVADFADIDVVMLTIDAVANSDLALDFIETIQVPPIQVPEPGPLLLLATGLLGIVAGLSLSRRRADRNGE